MAALSITAANVKSSTDAGIRTVTYGETVTQGEPLRLDTATQEYMLCKNDVLAEAAATVIALTPGGDGEPGVVMGAGGSIFIGATVVAGTPYYVGPNDGEIVPHGDLSSSDYVTCIGHATSTTVIKLSFDVLGIAVA